MGVKNIETKRKEEKQTELTEKQEAKIASTAMAILFKGKKAISNRKNKVL